VNDDYVTVSTAVDSGDAAVELARKIIDARLAACVQRMPIQSTYWWEGKVENADEVLLLSKTRASLAGKLTSFIKANHSYDVPEVIVTPIVGGNADYLDWLGETVEG
jgi:periplasmic divalent cation tolerance protein